MTEPAFPAQAGPERDEHGAPGTPARDQLGVVLVAAGVVTETELEEALTFQRSVVGARRRLGHVLVDLGLASERQIADALGDQLGLPVVDLNKVAIAPETVRLLPRAVAHRLGMLVLSTAGREVTVAAVDPTDVVALDDARLHTGASELRVTVATESQVRDHLVRVWSLSEDATDVTTFFEDVDLERARQRRGHVRGRRRPDRPARDDAAGRRGAGGGERHPRRAAAVGPAHPLPGRRRPA